MQFKRARQAAFAPRACKFYPRRSDLCYFFGLAMVKPYIHNLIRLDLEECPMICHPAFDIDFLPTSPVECMAEVDYCVEVAPTANIARCSAITLVDQNATKVLVEIEV